MIETVYREWRNKVMGVTRRMEMPVEVQRLDDNVTNYQGHILPAFWMPNWYATGPELYQCYLREAALQELELAQLACVNLGASLLIVDSYRSWEQQAKAYKEKPHLAVAPDVSNHPKGTAIDVRGHDITYKLMVEILGDYEWHPTVPHEPWHFDYLGSLD